MRNIIQLKLFTFIVVLLLDLCKPVFAIEPIKVATSFVIIQDLVEQIGGEYVETFSVVPRGQDSHNFQLRPSDVIRLSQADVLFVNGLHFDEWVDHYIDGLSDDKQKIPVITLSEGMPVQIKHDGHAWLNLQNAEHYTQVIAKTLAELIPERANYFFLRQQQYKVRLAGLYESMNENLSEIPLDKRRIITSHDALTYLAKAFDIQVVAPQGTGHFSKASAKDMAKLIHLVRAEQIKVLFMQELNDSKLLQQVAKETGLSFGDSLFVDTFSDKPTEPQSYYELMHWNISAIIRGLEANITKN